MWANAQIPVGNLQLIEKQKWFSYMIIHTSILSFLTQLSNDKSNMHSLSNGPTVQQSNLKLNLDISGITK